MKTIELPEVSRCDASVCAFNNQNGCRARAITIGDGSFPGCDTFLGQAVGNVEGTQVAGVGACKVGGCKYNVDFVCQAESIAIATASAPPACQTFAARV